MPAEKKVLIISYYWPPAGGPGVQRVLKFAKYLPQFGWTPVILTVSGGEYPADDHSMVKEIPEECIVYKTPTVEFYRWYKLLTGKRRKDRIETFVLTSNEGISVVQKIFNWIRLNFFIPDARIGWLPFARYYGKKILKKEKPDIIFSSSPPQTAQLIARWLAKRSGIPLVTDFRDPWMNAFYDQGMPRAFWARWINNKMESKVLDTATAVITVSPGYRSLMNRLDDPRFNIITNGFDADDFRIPVNNSAKGTAFSIIYSGHLSPLQNPENLWVALQQISALSDIQITLDIFGYVDSGVIDSMKRFGVFDRVRLRGYISHDQLVVELIRADLLLLLLPRKHNKGMIAGKLYEYLATGNPILTIGDPESDAAKILTECGADPVCRYGQDLYPTLQNKLQDWQQGALSGIDMEKVHMYTRKRLTGQLAEVFDRVLMSGKANPKKENPSSLSVSGIR